MGETLTQQRRVGEEAPWCVKPCRRGLKLADLELVSVNVPVEEAPANSVPAAAVIRRGQALFGFTGRKGRVGGCVSEK